MEIQGRHIQGSTAPPMRNAKGMPKAAEKEALPADVFSPQEAPPPSRSVPLTILHTNDIHGHAEPFCESHKMVGGLAHLAETIKEERAKDPAHTLLLDAGDSTQGDPLSDFFKGRPVLESMNKMGYDVCVLGNHDFDNGLKTLAGTLKKTKSPVLAANLVIKKENAFIDGCTEPFVIKDIDGVKVGIVGLVTPDAITMLKSREDAAKIDIRPPEETLREVLPEMKKQGADVVVLLSHLGIDADREVARQFPDISLIVGGHTHTKLDRPIKEGKTLIVQSGCYGRHLGEIELLIDRDSKRVSLNGSRLIPIEEHSVEPDKKVEAIIKKYEEKIAPILGEVVTEIKRNLTQRDFHVYREESTLGNCIADLIRERGKTDIGFITAASMRCNLYRGPVKTGDIYTMFPWQDQFTTVKLKGCHIPRLIEQGLSKIANGVAFSGIKAVIDTRLPEGQQVVSVTDENGKPLDPDRLYTIATRDYIAQGFSGMDVMHKSTDVKNHGDLRKNIIDALKETDHIDAKKDGRLINLATQKVSSR
ncbi:MAG: bifunctional UDP-sugar hydrolase/5'-nucleotidase [Candidatus Eremiobacteraeota bacterium]|nr:bifunctional UDP-sugar hydrolase/5'-nucleotidase [Candidatus Eremiobacteraeota bacterium]